MSVIGGNDEIILVINLRKNIVYFTFYFNLKIVMFFCRTLYLKGVHIKSWQHVSVVHSTIIRP